MRNETVQDFGMHDPRNQSERDLMYTDGMEAYFQKSLGTSMDKLRNFAKFVPRQTLSLFLAKHELFRHVLEVHGHIIECGVYLGGGLMTFANLSAMFEPFNHVRRIVGFDTFTGFMDVSAKDKGEEFHHKVRGGLASHAHADLQECMRLYDLNRPIGHIPRVELVGGDATQTIPEYVANHQHLVVALLYLDFDLYEPTKVALETFLPRMPKGAVLAFDELDQKLWPGETVAVLETIGLRNLRVRRFPYMPQLSYALLD